MSLLNQVLRNLDQRQATPAAAAVAPAAPTLKPAARPALPGAGQRARRWILGGLATAAAVVAGGMAQGNLSWPPIPGSVTPVAAQAVMPMAMPVQPVAMPVAAVTAVAASAPALAPTPVAATAPVPTPSTTPVGATAGLPAWVNANSAVTKKRAVFLRSLSAASMFFLGQDDNTTSQLGITDSSLCFQKLELYTGRG